jgi:hypothetical protein
VISDGRKSFPINHGQSSKDTLLEVSSPSVLCKYSAFVYIQNDLQCKIALPIIC